MRRVSKAVLRLAAGIAIATILVAPAAIASSVGSKKNGDPLIDRIVVWLRSRLSVPGG
jgi:hypothetical protein